MRGGPAAAAVVRLQARLLELQQQEVEKLQEQVGRQGSGGAAVIVHGGEVLSLVAR